MYFHDVLKIGLWCVASFEVLALATGYHRNLAKFQNSMMQATYTASKPKLQPYYATREVIRPPRSSDHSSLAVRPIVVPAETEPGTVSPQPVRPEVQQHLSKPPDVPSPRYADPLGSEILNAVGGPTVSNGLGSGSGSRKTVYRIDQVDQPPILVNKVEPEYSEEARAAKYSGTVLLSVVISETGIPEDIHVVRPLGLGLDEEAMLAVHRWRFRPAIKAGQPVAAKAQVEVIFRLLEGQQ